MAFKESSVLLDLDSENEQVKTAVKRSELFVLCTAVCMCLPGNAWVSVGSDVWMITLISSFCLGHNTH